MVVALLGFSRGPGGKTTTSIFGVLFGYTRGGKTNQEGRGHQMGPILGAIKQAANGW